MCGWLNNPSVSEIFPRNSLLLQRDRRLMWKVEMINLNPLLMLGAGSAARMADNKCLLKGFFISSVLILIRTTHLLTLPTFLWRKGGICAGDTVSVGYRTASTLRRSLCDYREHLCRCWWRNHLWESAETPPANPCKTIVNCFWLYATKITCVFQIHLSR